MRWWVPILLLGACRHGVHDPLEELVDNDPGIEAAKCCRDAKRWEATEAGWASPSLGEVRLKPGEKHQERIRLARGVPYRFEACGEEGTVDLNLFLYSEDGDKLIRDDSTNREPLITWKTDDVMHYLVITMGETADGQSRGVAWSQMLYDKPVD